MIGRCHLREATIGSRRLRPAPAATTAAGTGGRGGGSAGPRRRSTPPEVIRRHAGRQRPAEAAGTAVDTGRHSPAGRPTAARWPRSTTADASAPRPGDDDSRPASPPRGGSATGRRRLGEATAGGRRLWPVPAASCRQSRCTALVGAGLTTAASTQASAKAHQAAATFRTRDGVTIGGSKLSRGMRSMAFASTSAGYEP